jgi:VWFA-related protein
MLNKIGRARQALWRFFTTIRRGDEVFLQAFNHRSVMLQDFTDRRVLLDQGATVLEPLRDTALYDALQEGLWHVNQGRRQKRALVVLTDGLDTASRTSLEEVVASVQRSDVMVYTIGIGNPAGDRHALGMGLLHRPPRMGGMRFPGGHWPGMGIPSGRFPGIAQPPPPLGGSSSSPEDTVNVQVLQTFSNESGGKHFLLNTTDVLGNQAVLDLAVQAIADELRQQYTMGYKSALKGDVHRRVRIEPCHPGLSVRTHKRRINVDSFSEVIVNLNAKSGKLKVGDPTYSVR